MLVKATLDDVEKYCGFIFDIALDQTRSCYPTYADGIKTKEDFITNAKKGVTQDNWELLLFSIDGIVEGWLEYFWIQEDNYLQLCACNVNRGTEQALTELLALLREHFPGYTLYFGFPESNTDAVHFLLKNGFESIEEEWDNTFFLENFIPLPEDADIVRIGRDDFDDFREVYKPDSDTYWNCDRIFEQIDQWVILVYYNDGHPVGAVFFQGEDGYYEIYGVESASGRFRENIYRALLIAALNYCKRLNARYVTYFCDENSHKVVLDLGFHCIGKYICYQLAHLNTI